MSKHEKDASPAVAQRRTVPATASARSAEPGTATTHTPKPAAPDFGAMFEAVPAAVVVIAPDVPRFTILAASDAYLVAARKPREALIGRPLFEVFPDANPENPAATGVANLRLSLQTVLRTRAPHAMAIQRYDGERPDGTWAVGYWALRNVPVLGPDGTVHYILHQAEDVTDRVAEREATQSAERRAAELRAVLESMSDAVYIGTVDGITLANPAALDQLGYSTQEALNRHIGTLADEILTRDAETGEFIPVERQAFARALGGERVVQDVIVRHRRTGEDRVVRCAAAPVVVDGQVIAAVAVNTDVTDARRAAAERERLLAASDAARAEAVSARAETEAAGARAAAVLASIADAFYLLDRDWRFTYVNDAAEPLLQSKRATLLGRTLWEAFPGVVGSVFEGPYREAMATGRVTSVEAYFAPLGTWFDVRTYPWTGGLMVHFRDIGARKTAEAERERLLADADAARREAEAANQSKSQFLAMMSHELRTPLNAIGGYAELIELGIYGLVTDAQRVALARIQVSQRHLLGLISGVLDYSRVEAGAVSYRLIDVPVAEAVAEAEVLLAPQLRARGLGFASSGAPRDLRVRADREKLQQILLNLLGNAVKFTHERDGRPGRIEVSWAAADGVAGSRVAIHVRDTGEGIAPAELERVFEPFVQVDQRLTRPHAGVGLGLAISRDLARGMGGDLTAESVLGEGSTFTLVLPHA